MTPKYYRDITLLKDILERQEQMVKAMELFECYTEKDMYSDRPCIDLCSMYIVQIVELYRRLTDYSAHQLRFLNFKIVALRNDIVHNYTTIDTKYLINTIITMKSKRSMEMVKKAIEKCEEYNKVKKATTA